MYMAARITMMLLLGNKLSFGQDHIDGDASRNTCILEVVQFHILSFFVLFHACIIIPMGSSALFARP